MRYSSFRSERVIFGRLETGEDLLKSLSEVVAKERIKSGVISLIGALSKFRIGFFIPETGGYEVVEREGLYELVSCVGNISWMDGKPVVHIHMVVSNEEEVFGGHVLEGCIVGPTVEFSILELDREVYKKYFEDVKLNLLDL